MHRKYALVSVIMPSYLSEYPNCSKNREQKFIRAVNSFLDNNYKYKELVIVADGCDKTMKIYQKEFKQFHNIRCYKIEKQSEFSGAVRDYGLQKAHGNIICYLDTDDVLGTKHIENLVKNFNTKKFDWVYFNDFVRTPDMKELKRHISIEKGSIGTSCIAHRNIRKRFFWQKKHITWLGCDKYNHDFLFIEKLYDNFPNYNKIDGCQYYVCHIPNRLDV